MSKTVEVHRGLRAPPPRSLRDRHGGARISKAPGTSGKVRGRAGCAHSLHHPGMYTAGWTYACELMAVNQVLPCMFSAKLLRRQSSSRVFDGSPGAGQGWKAFGYATWQRPAIHWCAVCWRWPPLA